MFKKSGYFPFQTKLPCICSPIPLKTIWKNHFNCVTAIIPIAFFYIARTSFWLCQRSMIYGTWTSLHYWFIHEEQFGSLWLSISEVFFFFKCMAPAWVCFVFQLQCTLQTYCLIYFIFIKVISEVGMTLGPLL